MNVSYQKRSIIHSLWQQGASKEQLSIISNLSLTTINQIINNADKVPTKKFILTSWDTTKSALN